VDPGAFGASREEIRLHLEGLDVESRPVWKPMHLQPVFSSSRFRGGSVAERIFEGGLCLPSGSSLTEAEIEKIAGRVLELRR
jgi:dTDP-4-amino-4,6-dideoxygalactose transaminase